MRKSRRVGQVVSLAVSITCVGAAMVAAGGAAAGKAAVDRTAAGKAAADRTAAVKSSIVGKQVADFLISDSTGKQVALHDFRDKPVVLVYFLGTDCPISNLYLNDLAELQKTLGGKGVQVVGIHSSAGITQARAAAHAKEYKVSFPVLIDAGQRVADDFGATRTAEVFALDGKRTIRFHGSIDGRYGYTYKRGQAQRHDLERAALEMLAGTPVTVAETTPRGCLITRDDRGKTRANVTYAKDVSRILQNRCEECHRKGEVAPFTLSSFDDAVEHSAMMKEVIVQRRMPPWHADPRYGSFSNDRRMAQDEIDKVMAWIDAGTPLGDKKELPPPRQYADGWQIGKPDLVFELPNEVAVPATGTVAYKYYTVPTHLKKDIWVQAAEARAGNRSVVHHIIVFCRTPGATDGGLDSHVCGTAPGDPPLVLPPGVARKIPAGSELVFQMHYTPSGKAATDRSRVGFVLYRPDTQGEQKFTARTRPVMNPQIRIPAGDANYLLESSYQFADDAMIYQLMPHMHVRGKDFLFELNKPDGTKEVLLSVPNFDFNWQNTYRLTKPVAVPKGSTMHCVAHFDNSKDNPANPDPTKIVRWGDQTWEEMMIGWVTYSWTSAKRQGPERREPGERRRRFRQESEGSEQKAQKSKQKQTSNEPLKAGPVKAKSLAAF